MRGHTWLNALPETQLAARARCRHPSGRFVPFLPSAIEQSVPERFAQIVREHGDRVAIATRAGEIRYRELAGMAQRVAQSLASAAAHGLPVVALLDTGPWMIATLLGTLEASAMFVPMDPSSPLRWLAAMATDLDPVAIVTERKHLLMARSLLDREVVVVVVEDLAALAEGFAAPSVSPEALAYVLYTSGSTGKPKGVMQSHRGLLHDAMSWTNGVQVCVEDRLLLLTTYTQLGMQVMAAALLNGACLVPLNVNSDSIPDLGRWLVQQRVTIFRSTATFFRHFIQMREPSQRLPDLRVVRLGGEPVLARDWQACVQSLEPACVFYNAFATTEAGTITEYLWCGGMAPPPARVPVGYPVPGVRVRLLDADGGDVPPGATGEIVVESAYLSPGYWRHPEATAASYREDAAGTRRYLTGDLGSVDAEGALTHLGRRDFQLKIRGYRVEPAEIEQALLDHSGIREAVVAAAEDAQGEPRLTAFVVPRGAASPAAAELVRHMAERLPPHLVPSSFVTLDALPLTPNGKVDRRALVPPALAAEVSDLPRNATEAALATIWAEVLSVKQVGIRQRFLELGGNSLLAMRVVSRVLAQFRVELPLRSLFDAPTVEKMAQMLRAEDVGSDARDLEARSNLTRNQLLVWIGHQLHAGVPLYSLVLRVALSGAVDVPRLQRAFAVVVASHDALRTVFVEEGGVPMQKVLESMPVPFACVDLRAASDPQAAANAWVEARAARALDPSRCVFDAAVLQLTDDRCELYLSQHQLASDGVSCRLLLERLDTAYQADVRVAPAHPPFADYVRHERAWRQTAAVQRAEAYWRERLRTPSAPRRVQGTRVRRVLRSLSPQVAEPLRRRAAEQALPAVWLLSGFAAVLAAGMHRCRGATSLTFATPIHDRTSRAFRQTVGAFLQLMPLRLVIEPHDALAALHRRLLSEYEGNAKHTPYVVLDATHDAVVSYLPLSFPATIGGLPATVQRVHTGHEVDALALHVRDTEDAGFELTFELHEEVFARQEGDEVVGVCEDFVEAWLMRPQERVDGV